MPRPGRMSTFGNNGARPSAVLPWLILACVLSVSAGHAAAPEGVSCLPPPGQWSNPADAVPGQAPPELTARGLVFPIAFPSVAERIYWSADLVRDLGEFRYIELELSMEGEGRPRYMSLYFRSGGGWYGAQFPAPGGTRYRVFLTRDDFAAEERPAGWAQVDGMRLAVWRSGNPAPARVVVHSIRAYAPTALVLVGAASVHPTEREVAAQAARRVSGWLGRWGIAHDRISEARFIAERAGRARVVILPYNTHPDVLLLRALQRYQQAGGRLIVCYGASGELAQAMGFRIGRYTEDPTPGRWTSFVWSGAGGGEVPLKIFQETRNILPVYPATREARVCGWWEDATGRRAEPAWLVSPKGWWMTHVPTDEDARAKEELFLRMVGAVEPAAWRRAAELAVAELAVLPPWGSWTAALEDVGGHELDPDARDRLERARVAQARALEHLAQGRYPEVLASVRRAREDLAHAWAHTVGRQAGRRAVWDHVGVERPEAELPGLFERLAAAGVDHVFFYTGSLALMSVNGAPVPERLQTAARLAREKGIHLHAWVMIWSLHHVTPGLMASLRDSGRLQTGAGLDEPWPWLCPDHGGNLQSILRELERMARVPGLYGLHMDYVRYCEKGPCACAATRGAYEMDAGRRMEDWPACIQYGGSEDKAFREWRATRMNVFVRHARDRVRQVRGDLVLSAAVFADHPESIAQVGQDWGEWIRRDWVDFVAPMAYHGHLDLFRVRMQQAMAHDRAAGRIWAGIGVSSGEETGPEAVLARMETARQAGAPDAAFFALDRVFLRDILPLLEEVHRSPGGRQ